jgi:flagellar basal-body rod protein FlgF
MEINGRIRAANALHYWERRQEIAAHNLANSDTTGFKAERVFARMVGDAIPVADTATDMRAGTVTNTGQPLDFALGDLGFLVVDTPGGERLTRGGSFELDTEGRIVDQRGNPLLGEGGEIIVAGGSIDVNRAGVVRVDGREVGRLRVETVPADVRLAHEAGTYFIPDEERIEVAAEARDVRQGHIEASNVNTIGSMVDLISIQRNFAAVQRAVVTLDDVRSTIVNDLGRPV